MATAILYKANETDFSHLGLGPLNDAISILVTEERNGIFELEMKYPVSGKLFKELKNDRIIKADAGHKLKDQRFKIIRITKPLKGIVTVYAEHVSYLTQDLALKPKVSFNGNARQALEHWKANLVDDNPFTVWSDISTTGKIEWTIDEVENARRALGGVQGSILDVYGGEYLFDNYDIYLYQKRGVNSELLIAYGRNIVDLEQEEEIANTYTSIYPYSIYTDDDGNERMVTLPEYYIDSEYVDKYARRKILVVDFSTDDITTVSALRNAAIRYIEDNNIGVPRVNLKVKYLDLSKTLDYKHQALLEEVNLCDNVMIYFEKYDINTTAKVIKVVWDVLNERYDSIEVGESRASLSQAIDTVVDGKVHNVEKLAMQTLRTADGKNTIYFGLEEPLATQYPLKKNDIWYRIVDGEFTRTYRYDGAVWQLIIDMDSQQAKIEAQQAKDEAQQAVDRANQATQQATNAINQAQTAFDEAQQALGTANNAMTQAISAFTTASEAFAEVESLSEMVDENTGEISTIKQSVIGLQTRVSDNEGNISNLTQIAQGLQTQVTDIEGNVSTLQQTAQGLQSSVTNLQNELDGLEIGGRNLLLDTFYLSNEAFISRGDVTNKTDEDIPYVIVNGTSANLRPVLLQPNEEYTLSVDIRNFDKESPSRSPILIQWYSSSDGPRYSYSWSSVKPDDVSDSWKRFTVSFKAPNDRPWFSLGLRHAEFRLSKLEKGNRATDWTPAPEDIDHQFSVITQTIDSITTRVGDAEGNITALQQTSSSLAARLTDAEGNITTLTATVNGLQTTVSNVQGDVSSVTQLANALQVRMTDAEGNISTLTQTASSLQSTVSSLQDEWDNLEIGGRNLYQNSKGPFILEPRNTGQSSDNYNYYRFYCEMELNETYTISADIEITHGDFDKVTVYTYPGGKRSEIPIPSNGRIKHTFVKTSETIDSVLIYAGLSGSTRGQGIIIRNVKIEKGNKATDWTPAVEDMATQSQITQLSDAINLRVQKGDVINQINISDESILIDGKRIHITGQTTIDNGVIKSAHIESLDAGKITTGTLDAALVSVINLSANSIVGGILQSHNDNITFDLNRSEFIIRSGGQFIFQDSGNGIKYVRNNHSAGMIMANSSNANTPLVAIGTDTGSGVINANSPDFNGIMIQAKELKRHMQFITSSSIFATRTDLSTGAIILRTDGSTGGRGIFPQRSGLYKYDLGTSLNPWSDIYADNIKSPGYFTIQNTTASSGFRFDTTYQDGAPHIYFRGLSTASYYYAVGAPGYRFRYIYLTYEPDVSSDERLKEDISENKLGLDFINDVSTKMFRMKSNRQEPLQFGILAQELKATLEHHGINTLDHSIVKQHDDGYYGVQATQLIFPTIKAVQELDLKVESVKDDVEWLKLENQYLKQKVKQLEEMIS